MKKLLLTLCIALSALQTNAQCWEKIDAGDTHVVAIKTDGTLWAWGSNGYGQVGNGTTTKSLTPTQISNATDWMRVSAATNHTIALKTDGTLWAWGRNDIGQLGNGTINKSLIPIMIGIDNDWDIISADGDGSNLAIKKDGTLWAWGNNDHGQLGDGTVKNKIQPIQIGLDNDWIYVSAGHYHSVGIKKNGTLWSWGYNYFGQLGLGINYKATDFQKTPLQTGNSKEWKMVIASDYVTAALKNDGSLWTWGYNYYGTLGDGTNDDRNTPTKIGNDSWSFINTGYLSMGGIKAEGTLWTWGDNQHGQLGDGELIDKNTPTQTTGIDWNFFSGGGEFSIGLKTDGSLWSWGSNWNGELGYPLENGYFTQSPAQLECPTANINQTSLQSLTIYPNPATNILNINNAVNINIEKVTVFDVTGKTIITQTNALTVNVQPLPTGIYFIKIQSGTGSTNHKFIKQ